jgi:hypothetical protein
MFFLVVVLFILSGVMFVYSCIEAINKETGSESILVDGKTGSDACNTASLSQYRPFRIVIVSNPYFSFMVCPT